MKVAIAAGGTGGHITPALRVVLKLREKGYESIWFGRKDSLEERIAKRYNIPFISIDADPLKKGIIKTARSVFQLMNTIRSISSQLKQHKVTCVFATGAYVSLATALAGKTQRIPLVIHEQNMHMGLANRVLMRLATSVCLGMPIATLPDDWYVGNPAIDSTIQKRGKKLLVVGGSQGASFLNSAVPDALARLHFKSEVIHIAGKNKDQVIAKYQALRIDATVYAFVEDMTTVYGETGMVIARAGAMTLSEVSQYALPAILVPYPHAASDHQRKNANFYQNHQAAIVIEESVSELNSALSKLLDPALQENLIQSIQKLYKPNSLDEIIKKIESVHAQPLSN